MAEATHGTREVVTATTEPVIRLEMSEDEARTLSVVLSRCGGSMRSPRRHTNAIGSALSAVGVEWFSAPEDSMTGQGAISFRDYSDSADA